MFVGKSSVPFERESDSGEWYKCERDTNEEVVLLVLVVLEWKMSTKHDGKRVVSLAHTKENTV